MQPSKFLTEWPPKATAAASSLRRCCTMSKPTARPILGNASSRAPWPTPSWILKLPKNGSQWSKKHGRDSIEKNGPPRLPAARRNLPHGTRPGVRPRDQEDQAGSGDSERRHQSVWDDYNRGSYYP